MGEGFGSVSYQLCDCVDVVFRAYDLQYITELKQQIAICDEFDSSPDYSSHGDIEIGTNHQALQFLTGEGRFGDAYSSGDKVFIHFHPVGLMHGDF